MLGNIIHEALYLNHKIDFLLGFTRLIPLVGTLCSCFEETLKLRKHSSQLAYFLRKTKCIVTCLVFLKCFTLIVKDMDPKTMPIWTYSEYVFILRYFSSLIQHKGVLNWMHGYNLNELFFLYCEIVVTGIEVQILN